MVQSKKKKSVSGDFLKTQFSQLQNGAIVTVKWNNHKPKQKETIQYMPTYSHQLFLQKFQETKKIRNLLKRSRGLPSLDKNFLCQPIIQVAQKQYWRKKYQHFGIVRGTPYTYALENAVKLNIQREFLKKKKAVIKICCITFFLSKGEKLK